MTTATTASLGHNKEGGVPGAEGQAVRGIWEHGRRVLPSGDRAGPCLGHRPGTLASFSCPPLYSAPQWPSTAGGESGKQTSTPVSVPRAKSDRRPPRL